MGMEKIMKNKLLISLLAMAMILISGCGKTKTDDSTEDKNEEPVQEEQKNNINEGVVEDKNQEGLSFTNSSLVYDKNNSTLVTKVTNNTEENIAVRIFNIYVKDKDDNIIVTLIGYVGGEIPAGQSRDIETNVDMSLEDAFKIDYEIVND